MSIWYHGEPQERRRWDDQRWDRDASTSSLNEEGPGIYFTDSESEAQNYGPYLYVAEPKANFRLMPSRKATVADLRHVYNMASEEDREIFVTNWGEEYPTSVRVVDGLLKKYTGRDNLHDALVGMYGDLIRDPREWVDAIRSQGYDGVVVKKRSGRKHFIIWSPEKLRITGMF